MSLLTNQDRKSLDAGFVAAFGGAPKRYFSAPGRTEIGGNHTDHQRGRVLAAAVNLDTVAAVALNGTDTIRIQSAGYPLYRVDLKQLESNPDEYNTTTALIRGVAARFVELMKEHGIKTNELANRAGVTPSSVYSMLDPRRKEVSVNLVKKLCDGLDMTLGEFFSTQKFDELEQEIQ